jgi:hypothetical protein
LTQAIASVDASRTSLWWIAAGGVLTGILTPLLPPPLDKIHIVPGDYGIALAAVPFAVLVFVVVRRSSAGGRR